MADGSPRPMPLAFSQYRVVERACDRCNADVAFSCMMSISADDFADFEEDGDETENVNTENVGTETSGLADAEHGGSENGHEIANDNEREDESEDENEDENEDEDEDENEDDDADCEADHVRSDVFGCASRGWFRCAQCPTADFCANCHETHEHACEAQRIHPPERFCLLCHPSDMCRICGALNCADSLCATCAADD